MARIALFIHGLSGGGVQRATMNLATELLERGHSVDLLVGTANGASLHLVPPGATLRQLERRPRLAHIALAWRAEPEFRDLLARPVLFPLIPQKALYYLAALTEYLGEQRPDLLISADTYCNIVAVWARKLAGVATKVIVSERNALSAQLTRPDRRHAWRWRHAPGLVGHVYPQADGIVAVSNGVGDDLAELCGIPRGQIVTIYNGTHAGPLRDQHAAERPDHPWMRDGELPVILGIGRLVRPKNFAMLIRAFAILRRSRPARLLILGEEQLRGERARLLALARTLGVETDVQLPGHVKNPYPYLRHAAVFALSSTREGIANVVIEALSCGCPVVSTNCRYGPDEVLESGRYGRLVPVGDAEAMAVAIAATLDAPPDANLLRARGATFGAGRAASAYLALAGISESELDEAPGSRLGHAQHVARFGAEVVRPSLQTRFVEGPGAFEIEADNRSRAKRRSRDQIDGHRAN